MRRGVNAEALKNFILMQGTLANSSSCWPNANSERVARSRAIVEDMALRLA